MEDIIQQLKKAVLQIATPFTTGTGFYLQQWNIIVTNEHVIRGNKKVVIKGHGFSKELVDVLFIDKKRDIAFLQAPMEHEMSHVALSQKDILQQGEKVLAVGHPFGLNFTATQGIISNLLQEKQDVAYIQHDAALNPGNSGGPLVNKEGKVVGVNTFIMKEGNSIGFALPISLLLENLNEFSTLNKKGQYALRCSSCSNVVVENDTQDSYCPHCGASIDLLSKIVDYQPEGPSAIIERVLESLTYTPSLARTGPHAWEVDKGSAKISINFNKKASMITCDAELCLLPKKGINEIYAYLLQQNYEMNYLTFSVKGNSVLLSLLIHEANVQFESAKEMMSYLFDRADHYDDILVDEFSAIFKNKTPD